MHMHRVGAQWNGQTRNSQVHRFASSFIANLIMMLYCNEDECVM